MRTRLPELAVDQAHSDLQVLTGSGWTEWFYRMIWDYGWVMSDVRNMRVHLLCASGND